MLLHKTQSEKQNDHVHSSHSGRHNFRARRRNALKNKKKKKTSKHNQKNENFATEIETHPKYFMQKILCAV